MSRKKFIESFGATCDNWTWSWSFVNEKEKFVIFGVWNVHIDIDKALILGEDWKISPKGRRQPAFSQSKKHIELIVNNGYRLKTFTMKYSSVSKLDKTSPARISGFDAILNDKKLIKIGNNWYACDISDDNILAEEIINPELFIEGAKQQITINSYERNYEARKKCIERYGYVCVVCSFDFEKHYGTLGREYIHVHHVVPLSQIKKEYALNPITDLKPVCPNCHAMLHRNNITIDELRNIIEYNKA